jgi:hypothetical protein
MKFEHQHLPRATIIWVFRIFRDSNLLLIKLPSRNLHAIEVIKMLRRGVHFCSHHFFIFSRTFKSFKPFIALSIFNLVACAIVCFNVLKFDELYYSP